MAKQDITVTELVAGPGECVTFIDVRDHLATFSGGHGTTRITATTDGKKVYRRARPDNSSGLRAMRWIGDELWVTGEQGLIAVSKDRGETWTTIDTPTSACFWDITLDAKGNLWAQGQDKQLVKATLATRKFRLVKHAQKERDYRADPRQLRVPEGVLFLLYNAIWTGKQFVKPKGLTGAMSSAVISPAGTIVVVGDKGAGARSTDGGKKFSKISLGVSVNFNDVAVVAGELIAAGDKGTIRRSADDGVTWKPVASNCKMELWSIGSWGDGAFIGGDQGLVLRLATPRDTYWKGAKDLLAPKPVETAVFTPVKPPTQAERDATYAQLASEAEAAHERLAATRQPAIARDEHDMAILANPGDVDALRVYGDMLQERGDVHGQLVALGTTPGHDKRTKTFVKQHGKELLGELHGETGLELAWKHGFLDTARVFNARGAWDDDDDDAAADDKLGVADAVGRLLALPSARFLASLTVGIVTFEDNSYADVIAAIAKHSHPQLRELFLGDFESDETELSWSAIGDPSQLWGSLPNLERLVLRSGEMSDLGTPVLPKLRHLEIVTGGLTKAVVKSILKGYLPALEKLVLYVGASDYGCDIGSTRDLAPLLAATGRFPRLTSLAIRSTELADDLCGTLHTSPLVAQVTTLDLSEGTLSDRGARLLATYAPAFAHLDTLYVASSYLSKAGIRDLEKALPHVEIEADDQRFDEDDDDDYRYVNVGE